MTTSAPDRAAIERAIWAYYGYDVDQNDIDPDSHDAAAIERITAAVAEARAAERAKLLEEIVPLVRGIATACKRAGRENADGIASHDQRIISFADWAEKQVRALAPPAQSPLLLGADIRALLQHEVWRVCRKTNVADLVAVFVDADEAADYAQVFVETDQFGALIRDRTAAIPPAPEKEGTGQ